MSKTSNLKKENTIVNSVKETTEVKVDKEQTVQNSTPTVRPGSFAELLLK
jgi:hypothetical protein